MLLDASDVSLLLIDVQEKLFNKIHNNQSILKNILVILESSSKLGLPIIYTEQYPKGLGHTIFQLQNSLERSQMYTKKFEKTSFSCFPSKENKNKNKYIKTQQVLVAGIETHICVLQTAIDLQSSGFKVFILEDCVGSREEKSKCLALKRARSAGISIVNTEMALFELLRDSKHKYFKNLSSLIK
ncbi:MAG: isochorismatase family protein [Alphaproteobacteria bacterium]